MDITNIHNTELYVLFKFQSINSLYQLFDTFKYHCNEMFVKFSDNI